MCGREYIVGELKNTFSNSFKIEKCLVVFVTQKIAVFVTQKIAVKIGFK